MITLNLFIQRTHLYLALFLLPWLFMYGISSFFFNHPAALEDGISPWKVRFDRPYEINVPEGSDLRAVGARILQDSGLKGSFGVYRPDSDTFHRFATPATSWTRPLHKSSMSCRV